VLQNNSQDKINYFLKLVFMLVSVKNSNQLIRHDWYGLNSKHASYVVGLGGGGMRGGAHN
jgi:hypothetical protein